MLRERHRSLPLNSGRAAGPEVDGEDGQGGKWYRWWGGEKRE